MKQLDLKLIRKMYFAHLQHPSNYSILEHLLTTCNGISPKYIELKYYKKRVYFRKNLKFI